MSLLTTASLVVTPNAGEEGTLFSVVPNTSLGDLSVTRATTATRVNSAGLVELVPYNLLSYSEQIDNGYWSKYQSTITANNTTAPNGTLTADRLTQNGAGAGTFYVTPSAFNGGLVSLSCFYKKGIGNIGWLEINRGAESCFIQFNLDTQVISASGNYASTNIESVGNGWFRCSVVSNQSAGTANYIGFGNIGNNGDTIFAWGAQLNEGTLKPYQKTETRLNIPRLDYSNGTCPSILVEPQRSNSCLYSNNLSISPWINQTLNTTLTRIQSGGPDGNAFDRLVVGGSGYVGRYVQGITQVGTNTTFTAYLRGSGSVQLGVFNMGQTYLVTINLTNEWTRYENIVTTATNNTYMDVGIYLYGGTQVDVSSCQVEFATYATSYIPTTSASVTRNADVISKTGISSLIGQTEGTIFVDLDFDNLASQTNNPVLFSLLGNATIYMQVFTSGYGELIYSTGAGTQAYLYWPSVTNGHHKIAFGYKANDFVLYIDGVQVATDTSGSVDTLSSFYFGYINSSFNPTANYKAAALWKTRLTNAQLATLTTI